MSCGHPLDVFCTACDRPVRTSLDVEIDHLDAQIMALNLRGRTDAEKDRARELHAKRCELLAEREERRRDIGDDWAEDARVSCVDEDPAYYQDCLSLATRGRYSRRERGE